MEIVLLRESEQFPDNQVLKETLQEKFPLYDHLISVVSHEPYSLDHHWNYYKDGKSWLCKVTYRKKTIFWLSVWDTCFKTSFFFTEKNRSGIMELTIDDSIKHSFSNSKNIGKLIPLVISINDISQLDDVLKIIEFKKTCK
ncbi:MAG: hypothetical protein A2X18_06920 [Bacteroidetes bacterium GWF2_40_14]|nr:MAG: hypothetical protein A2X18_06920 [Bacteroidetes bacterium GWF2_40_14]